MWAGWQHSMRCVYIDNLGQMEWIFCFRNRGSVLSAIRKKSGWRLHDREYCTIILLLSNGIFQSFFKLCRSRRFWIQKGSNSHPSKQQAFCGYGSYMLAPDLCASNLSWHSYAALQTPVSQSWWFDWRNCTGRSATLGLNYKEKCRRSPYLDMSIISCSHFSWPSSVNITKHSQHLVSRHGSRIPY